MVPFLLIVIGLTLFYVAFSGRGQQFLTALFEGKPPGS